MVTKSQAEIISKKLNEELVKLVVEETINMEEIIAMVENMHYSTVIAEEKPAHSSQAKLIFPALAQPRKTKCPRTMNLKPEFQKPRVPEGTAQEEQVPEARVQEARVPEARVPDTRVPDTRVPEEQVPEDQVSED